MLSLRLEVLSRNGYIDLKKPGDLGEEECFVFVVKAMHQQKGLIF
jgi:hypothetical protein